jgi:hypothetical protein
MCVVGLVGLGALTLFAALVGAVLLREAQAERRNSPLRPSANAQVARRRPF